MGRGWAWGRPPAGSGLGGLSPHRCHCFGHPHGPAVPLAQDSLDVGASPGGSRVLPQGLRARPLPAVCGKIALLPHLSRVSQNDVSPEVSPFGVCSLGAGRITGGQHVCGGCHDRGGHPTGSVQFEVLLVGPVHGGVSVDESETRVPVRREGVLLLPHLRFSMAPPTGRSAAREGMPGIEFTSRPDRLPAAGWASAGLPVRLAGLVYCLAQDHSVLCCAAINKPIQVPMIYCSECNRIHGQ